MVFSSMLFIWIFLPITLLVYFLIPTRFKNIWLLVVSLLFYSWGEPKYIALMIFSICINYIGGRLLAVTEKAINRKVIFYSIILINLALLGYFKYFNFIILNLNTLFGQNTYSFRNIALPIGISFYTFQIMSYIIDLYRHKIQVQKKLFNLALYISFFPQLIAGPIVRYCDIEKQFTHRTINYDSFAYGIKRFIYGMAKKVLIANTLAVPVDQIFSLPVNSLEFTITWVGIICYTLQIYFDFSGYSDMAIGLGKMFGFDFNENFSLPYMADSIRDFWKRWHISLTTWFREYVYIPLGGNRCGTVRTYVNLFIVFLTTGIWHGASWNFIIWGLYHGMFSVLERVGVSNFLNKIPIKILKNLYTLIIIAVGWVFFRSETLGYAIHYIAVMFGLRQGLNDVTARYYLTPYVCLIILIGILCSGLWQKLTKFDNREVSGRITILEGSFLLIAFLLSLITLISGSYNPFIYFRF